MGDSDFHAGKKVLLTGAADGIGLALARALQAAKAQVFVSDIAKDKLEAAATELGAPSAVCDVTDATATEGLVAQAWDELGGLDLVCANAGVFVPGSVLESTPGDIAFLFDVNVWGMLHTVRPAVQRMRAEGRPGHLMFTGSENSLATPSYLRRIPGHVYNMTKHAVLSMADGLRWELEPEGIGVSVLCPGPVTSGLMQNAAEARSDRYGDAAAIDLDLGAALGEQGVQELVALYMPAERAAEIALDGLRRGLFVIPTHPHELEDATARFEDIQRGFEGLAR